MHKATAMLGLLISYRNNAPDTNCKKVKKRRLRLPSTHRPSDSTSRVNITDIGFLEA